MVDVAHLDLRCHLLLLVSQLYAGALPGGEVLGGGDHLAVLKLQVLHQQLEEEHRGGCIRKVGVAKLESGAPLIH